MVLHNDIKISHNSQQLTPDADPPKSGSPTGCELQQDGKMCTIWTVASEQDTKRQTNLPS